VTGLADRLDRMAAAVRSRCDLRPRVAILLGTGLGQFASRIAPVAEIPYGDIPGMPAPTVASHAGTLVLGHVGDVPVAAFSGRLHAYEGHPISDVVLPVRLAKWLGASTLVMGSIVGGMNPAYQVGTCVVLADHLNLMGVNPLVGTNDDRVGPRWPDMIDTYSADLRQRALAAATRLGVPLHPAVYAGVLGPNLETRAEYRWLRGCGADVVGMSTVPEAIAAVHCGLRTLALAIVTDRCIPDELEPADIARIIAAAQAGEPLLARLLLDLLPQM
jgi:purine-nucleoside phosphorylase